MEVIVESTSGAQFARVAETGNREFLRSLPKPEPSGGLEYYRHEREAALNFDPRRRENYERYLVERGRVAKVSYRPVKLDIENVSRCNFRCTMCVVGTWKNGIRAKDMSLDDFKNLIDREYGLVEIKLNGLGEALLQGDPYFDMIKYARSKKIWVRMTTNASLLHARSNYKKLVDSDTNEIDISIDGAVKKTFESIRKSSVFETVVKNCTLLNDYTRQKGIVRTKMWTLVQSGNCDELEEIVKLGHQMGFKHSIFSLNLHGWGDKELEKENRAKIVEHLITEERIRGLIALGESLDMKVRFWNVNDKFDARTPATLCPWPFERAVVTSDLKTVPCCMIGDPNAYEIGKGTSKSFSDLWDDEEFVDFRNAHLSGNIPAICQGCYT